jgi:hypothetical protein
MTFPPVRYVLPGFIPEGDADDPFDTISETLGLTGAADTLLILKRQSGGFTLFARGRDIQESETAVQFEKSSCRWSILDAAAEVHRSAERAKIMAALNKVDGDGFSISEIMAATESTSRNATDILLHKMREDGEVIRLTRGVYAAAGGPNLSASDRGKIGKKERSDSQGIQVTTQSANLSNLSDLFGGEKIRANGKIQPPRASPAADLWKDLGIPEFLDRSRPRLGPPAISSGPDDDLGDFI